MSDAVASPVFYLIPGLGADARIFERLRLHGTVRVLEWLEPTGPDEPLAAYTTRLAAPIPADEVCWVVGVSFGGVVALEVGCQRPNARVVLISSLPTPAERTSWVQFAKWLHVDAWLPIKLLRRLPRAGQWFFGVSGKRGDALFRELLTLLTPTYTKWALRQLFRWSGCQARPVAHLIGDRDRVFPIGYRTATHVIHGGTHFMIVTHATQISQILNTLVAA
jgi:pimeloyl-ACP methyl ester carboxylesterase